LQVKALFAELRRRNVIRVGVFYGAAAWLILQVADVLLEVIDAPEGSLRVIAVILALGFPFAMILAWAFEITPDGIKLESEIDRSQPDQGALAASNRKLDLVTIALLVFAIGLFSWVNLGGRDTAAPSATRSVAASGAPLDLSIAVLPFVNMSTDPENEYFSEGLSEELLNVLARIEDFRVAGRTSSFAFKGQMQDLRAIGERLSVANILEGSVRRQGDRVRVTAQLIDARSGYHLWSDTYDRKLDDVFAIQDEIAMEVVKALRRTLLPADAAVIGQTAKGDIEAYNHYLRGQFHARLRTRAGLERALEEFHQATVIDPDYAPSYAGIAMVYALLDNYKYRSLAETEKLAFRALERALALDPSSDEAWAIRGMLLGQGAGVLQRRDEARAALDRAVEINPNNAFAHLWRATALSDIEAARESINRAYDLDPLSPVIVYRRLMDALQARDQAALARFQGELEDVAPDWFMTWNAVGAIAAEQGHVAEAAFAFERSVALNPEYVGGLGSLANQLEMMGLGERAERLLEDARQRFRSEELNLQLAALRARRALLEAGPAAAVAIYRPAVESMTVALPQHHFDLAMLEIGAGETALADRRLRTAMGLGPEELPARPGGDIFLGHVVFVSLLAAQGDHHGLEIVSEELREMLADFERHGVEINVMPLIRGLLDHFAGHAGAMDAGLREAIRQGWRMPPATLPWLMSSHMTVAELADGMAVMEAALAGEHARYEAAKAAGGG
jgi:TolB-like protein/tetratricopeptide (TPR) repeat protein